MKTIKYLLFILFCSCATLLYSQVESIYYDAELSSDSIEMVANSLREQIDQWKQKVKENPKDEKAWMQYAGKLQSLKGISLLLSMKPSATLAVGADIQNVLDGCVRHYGKQPRHHSRLLRWRGACCYV